MFLEAMRNPEASPVPFFQIFYVPQSLFPGLSYPLGDPEGLQFLFPVFFVPFGVFQILFSQEFCAPQSLFPRISCPLGASTSLFMSPNPRDQEFFVLWSVPNPFFQVFCVFSRLKKAAQFLIPKHPGPLSSSFPSAFFPSKIS